ncbi:MAG: ABC transporter permease [Acidimicrobiia bacterium]|nr:ABC transporter permease [Acidimicrobiia bacterium]
MNGLSQSGLLVQQIGYQNKMFYRTPISAFFTLVFPLMLLVLFGALFGSERINELGVTVAQYFAPALAVFSAASATYTNISVGTAFQRDMGILKRIKGSPLPPWLFFAGKVGSATIVAAVAMLIMMSVGVLAYGVTIFPRTLPAAILTFLVGAACFACMGLLVAAVSPTGNAATAIANATLLPLAFLSGLFFPTTSETPQWLVTVGDIFPLKHFNDAFQATFLPNTTGAQFDWFALGYMALWGVVSLLLALRLFTWEPRSGD